jgi:hypothetical protein
MRYLALLVLSSFSNLPKLSKSKKAPLARSLLQQVLLAAISCRLAATRKFFGDDRDRTGGLRLAKAALSQLSYIPLIVGPLRAQHAIHVIFGGPFWDRTRDLTLIKRAL